MAWETKQPPSGGRDIKFAGYFFNLMDGDVKKTGWLTPNGDLVPCAYGEHDELAEKISESIAGFIFGFNVTPAYAATFSRTLENYRYLKIQENVLFVPDYNGWKDELFVTANQYQWLSKNIDLKETIPLRI